MIGDSGVGKTCILKRLEQSIFDENTPNTIGIEFVRKQIMLNDNTIMLQVWDTVGQENMHRYTIFPLVNLNLLWFDYIN
jgi:small GTP-binding protein